MINFDKNKEHLNMKKLIKASTDISYASACMFSLNDFVNILQQVRELNKYNISAETDKDANLFLNIGDSIYELRL